MRYLKLYEGRESVVTNWVDETIPNDIHMDLKDILLELSDEGFNISFQLWPLYEKHSRYYYIDKYPFITIMRWNKGKQFMSYYDLEEYIERVRDYLDSKGYNIIILANPGIGNFVKFNNSLNTKGELMRPYVTEIKIQMINRRIYGDVNESLFSYKKYKHGEIYKNI